jgi:hypothetical protein
MRPGWPELFEPSVIDPAVNFLNDLARNAAALELGIGTGRIADHSAGVVSKKRVQQC